MVSYAIRLQSFSIYESDKSSSRWTDANLRYRLHVVYMDDILITAKDTDEALERLEIVMKTLTEKGFSINLKKYCFLKEKVEFLGFKVSRGEVRSKS